MFQWETRLVEFSTEAVDPMVGIFLLSLKINDIDSSHNQENLCSALLILSLLTWKCRNKTVNNNNNKSAKQPILLSKGSFYYNEDNRYSHLTFLFTNKEIASV